MSKFILSISAALILFLSFNTISYSQKPEKVYSIVKQIKSFEWYKSQAELWGKILEKDKKEFRGLVKLLYCQQDGKEYIPG